MAREYTDHRGDGSGRGRSGRRTGRRAGRARHYVGFAQSGWLQSRVFRAAGRGLARRRRA